MPTVAKRNERKPAPGLNGQRDGFNRTINLQIAGSPNAPSTGASLAYQQLRRDIISAQYPLGGKLNIRALCENYEVGLTPMREALSRLSREGIVTQSDQRGFSVIPFSRTALEELTRSRIWLNELALRESIKHGDDRWEENIVLTFHRLSKLPRYVVVKNKSEPSYNSDWEDTHRAFHTSLIAACRSKWLITFCDQLFDAADYYRHLSRVSMLRRKNRTDEHEQMMKAAIARDADRAVKLLTGHVQHTADLVLKRLSDKHRIDDKD